MVLRKYDLPCPVCGKDGEIYPKDYNNYFLVICPKCGEYITEQTDDEKMEGKIPPYFKKIEGENEREQLSKWIQDHQNDNDPPKISRHGE